PLAFLIYLGLTSFNNESFSGFLNGPEFRHTIHCGLLTMLFGGLVLSGGLMIWRRTDPIQPALSGALIGLVGGLGGALAMGVACASHEAWHLWFAHGLAVVALIFAGSFAGRRLLAP